jgi:hypothetical protein
MKASDLDDIAPVVGYRAARILAAWFAGRRLHVPTRPGDGHPLVSLIGASAFAALVREFSGERFSIPSNRDDDSYRRDRSIAERFAAGADTARVADETGLTVRRVEQIRVALVAEGWLRYAQGFDTAKVQGRRASGTATPEFLGTGEVFDEPPPPSPEILGTGEVFDEPPPPRE